MKRKILEKKKIIYSAIFTAVILVSLVKYVDSAAVIKTYNLDTTKSGMLRTDDVKYINQYYCGDATYNEGMRVFLTFDISDISAGVNIDSAKLDLTHYVKKDDPFGDLGTMYVDKLNYGNSLDTGDYYLPGIVIATYSSPPTTVLDKPSLQSYVQDAVDAGDGKVQFRVRFYKKTDNDGKADDLVFSNIILTIAMSTPPLTPTFTAYPTVYPTFTFIPGSKPDLTVSDIFTNTDGNIAFTIANIGNASVTSQAMKLKVYKNGVLILNTTMILSVSSSGSITLNLTGSSAKVTGTDDVKVIVDADDDIAESNETNNERTETLTETPSPTTTPPPTTAAPTTTPPATTAAPTTGPPTTTPAPAGRFSVSKPEYKQGEAVEMYLESTGTTPIRLQNTAPWTVYKVEGGLFEVFRPVAAEMIAEVTDQVSWIWSQKNNLDENVPEGQYKIVLRTLNAGEYTASFKITGETTTETTQPPTMPTTQPQTTQPQTTTQSPLSSLFENPFVLIGGAAVLLLLVLIIVIAIKK